MNTIEENPGEICTQQTASPPRRSPLVKGTYKLKPNKPPTKPGPDNQLKTHLKAAIAVLTVSASMMGTISTIAGFARSMTPPPVTPQAPLLVATNAAPAPVAAPIDNDFSGLMALSKDGTRLGQCPLAGTRVDAKLSGYVARVNITQTYANPYQHKIEAVYNFPMSDEGAVDDMTMTIGDRVIKGKITTREEAKQIYDQANQAGHAAALLDQQRTNIFTQHVANIEPGKAIVVKISYVELLKFEDGRYTFSVPTTIGPRFYPTAKDGNEINNASNKLAAIMTANLQAPAINLPTSKLAVNVDIDAGLPIRNVNCKSYPVLINSQSGSHSTVALNDSYALPNKDFVLTYDLDHAESVQSGYLACRDPKAPDKDGYATFMLVPPAKVTGQNAAPKEMIFLLDCSGSQSGAPIEKAKETMHYIVDHMNPNDTFQVLAFNEGVSTLSKEPVHANAQEREKAHRFISGLQAQGGTWMAEAVEQVLHQKTRAIDDLKRLRIVTFMTDGYVGNDVEIMSMVKKERADSRWFTFGTGSSVNRALIDNVARLGGGEADYVLLTQSAEEVGKKFYSRISSPTLTDVQLKSEGLNLYDVYPKQVADVWANKPLYFTARYKGGARGKVTLTGFAQGKPYSQTLDVIVPAEDTRHASVEKIWARQKLTDLADQDMEGLASGQINPDIKKKVTAVALAHGLMSDFTSFVAVDSAFTEGGPSSQVAVPNLQPEGVVNSSSTGTIGGAIGLQGATNGTLAPLNGLPGSGGADSTIVQGVNTAGTVRINNLANLEATANLMAGAIEALGLLWGGITVLISICMWKRNADKAFSKMMLGALGVGIGICTPGLINWLIATLRDVGLFN
ncbi:MAG: VWA domain-containing protein [Cyanobacteria bacterium SZAS TMP-1]|nr:VWA domain-containing protein [Cyanobacteria bacterium SZAS TMP-1]